MIYDKFALNEAYEQGQLDFFFSINESAGSIVFRLLGKINNFISLVKYRGPIGMGKDLIRKRTPEEQREYIKSKNYDRMKTRLNKECKDKKQHSLIVKVLAFIAGFVFAVPLMGIIFLSTILFVNTVLLGVLVGMQIALIDKLLQGSKNALLTFLEGLKSLIIKNFK